MVIDWPFGKYAVRFLDEAARDAITHAVGEYADYNGISDIVDDNVQGKISGWLAIENDEWGNIYVEYKAAADVETMLKLKVNFKIAVASIGELE